MAKSTVDQLIDVYRHAQILGRAHKSKLVTMLTEDVGEKAMVQKKRGKKGTPGEEATP